jgi:hypothetical protein
VVTEPLGTLSVIVFNDTLSVRQGGEGGSSSRQQPFINRVY